MRAKWIPSVLAVAILTIGAAGQSRVPKTHRLEATPDTVAYGYYWASAKPVLRIASGDIIDVDTLLTNTPTGLSRAGVPDNKIQNSLKAIVNQVTGDRRGPGGHILTGPVYVEGAEPGDALEVKVLSIDFAIDAIETSFRGRIQLTVRKGLKLTWPRAETATDYISMAADPDLTVATKTAIQEMVDFLAATKKLTPHEAYQVISIAGNVAITQLVDRPNVGVHVKIPKRIFKQ
jgi:acetamidase/formamidase